MNTVHRGRLELAHAIKGETTEKPEVITERITKYVETLEE